LNENLKRQSHWSFTCMVQLCPCPFIFRCMWLKSRGRMIFLLEGCYFSCLLLHKLTVEAYFIKISVMFSFTFIKQRFDFTASTSNILNTVAFHSGSLMANGHFVEVRICLKLLSWPFFWWTGVWTQDFELVKQALYCFSLAF
jgi:hypothetical protein